MRVLALSMGLVLLAELHTTGNCTRFYCRPSYFLNAFLFTLGFALVLVEHDTLSGQRGEWYLTIIRSLLPVLTYWFAWGPATLLVHNTVNYVFQLDTCLGNRFLPFEFYSLGVASVALAVYLNGALRRGIGEWFHVHFEDKDTTIDVQPGRLMSPTARRQWRNTRSLPSQNGRTFVYGVRRC